MTLISSLSVGGPRVIKDFLLPSIDGAIIRKWNLSTSKQVLIKCNAESVVTSLSTQKSMDKIPTVAYFTIYGFILQKNCRIFVALEFTTLRFNLDNILKFLILKLLN